MKEEALNYEELSKKLIPDNYKNVLAITPHGELILMNTPEGRAYMALWGEVTIIDTEAELKNFRDEVNSGNTFAGKLVWLTSDINLNIGEEWEPIGKYFEETGEVADPMNKPFMGVFDGGGHEINGVKIDSSDTGVGLFGLARIATIMNLGLGSSCSISTTETRVGGICGLAATGTNIINCYNKGSVVGYMYVGGITRASYRRRDCYVMYQLRIDICYQRG